jgi:DNA-binding NarL/FixJ family response regulator
MSASKTASVIRVALIEDQKVTRNCLAALIAGSPGMSLVGEYISGHEAIAKMAPVCPDVILTDLGVPGLSGAELVKRLHELMPKVPIIVLTIHNDEENVFGALCHGALGYLLKDIEPSHLIAAIRESHDGGSPMSPEIARRAVLRIQRGGVAEAKNPMTVREREVLQLLAEGHSYKSCSVELGISIETIRFHVRNIYLHLQAHSKGEAVGKALRRGWVV